ncbi:MULTISPECIES: MarR family winged helix-turn-helix transcriptional regulator [Arthrobacter]|uniref:MarR family transcriptional regulator n=1 Tax=Arthrobacter terricola TaxID=2547396 RepID=A0A4R5KDT3_9MICC|nr:MULTISPECIES: MarR family transcriptional regulator [Arthrobacter]MBT8162251.1 MarR family transcriptional regulator [Arthrobacter sp. GN70]TDF92270.1 MarR family transcriptional regulator [Arthrobacter terricola]
MSEEGIGAAGAWSLTDVITRLRRTLRSSIREELPWESLPMAQVELLQRLAEEPGLGVSELAERQHLARNTVSNLVQQMVTAGLLERRPHESDRRAVVLRLSGAGHERLVAWQQANERRIRRAIEGLADQHREAIDLALPALRALAAQLEAQEAEAVGATVARAGR